MYEIIKCMFKSFGFRAFIHIGAFSLTASVMCSYALHQTDSSSEGFVISLFIIIMLSYFILIGKYEDDIIYHIMPVSNERIYVSKMISVLALTLIISLMTYLFLYIFSNSIMIMSASGLISIILTSLGMSCLSPIVSFLKNESLMLIVSVPLILFPIVLPAIEIFLHGISFVLVGIITLSSLIFFVVGMLSK